MNRKAKYKEKGYTDEQIENHYSYLRKKAKEIRERRKKNNEKNQKIITQIKNNILKKTFKFQFKTVKVLSVSETVDGKGFFYKVNIIFSDKSNGDFRYFYSFDSYVEEEFIKTLNI